MKGPSGSEQCSAAWVHTAVQAAPHASLAVQPPRPGHAFTCPGPGPPRSFEAACTGQASADASSEYGALVRTRVGGVAILLGAEIDCYDPATCVGACGTQQPSLGSYVEIKTYR